MDIAEKFISCDWGTSNFRLRLVDTKSLEVLQEIESNDGVKKLGRNIDESNRLNHFTGYLATQLNLFPEEDRKSPLVISGMASSTIGMKELPYALMPFSMDGDGMKSEFIKTDNGFNFILVSGVKSETSVMRGEEVQALGLAKYFGEKDTGVLVLPGTHSKHIGYQDKAFTTMKTFMTGELFQLLTEHSILAGSVLQSQGNEAAFLEGVKLGIKGKMSEHLFSVRVRDVIHAASKKENYFFLSGLLIGDELAYLKGSKETIVLAASGGIFDLYKLSFQQIMDAGNTIFCDSAVIQNALLEGHKKILIQHVKTK